MKDLHTGNMGAFKNARRGECLMIDQHNNSKSARIREAEERQVPLLVRQHEERQLELLLRQHEEIGEQIIALVHKTSLETEELIRTMRQKKPAEIVEFPKPAAQTQTPAWRRKIRSRIFGKPQDL